MTPGRLRVARLVGRSGVLLPLLVVLATSSDARATDPLEKWWVGLDAASSSPDARGVLLLRSPVESRVRFPGGRFIMGSTQLELRDAIDLCRREIEGIDAICFPGDEDRPPGRLIASLMTETKEHQVTLSSFAIDRTEVSVGAYGKCVAANVCARTETPLGDPNFDRPNLPVTSVTWESARAFCAFVGGRLPTEAEWEFAARGETRRFFPWGNLYNSHLANHGAGFGSGRDKSDGFEFLAPVDAFRDGATPEGVLQMAGNVSEWVLDFFPSDPTSIGYASGAVTNPVGPANGVVHITRGGSFSHAAVFQRSAARIPEWTFAPDVGFRCAYDR